MKKHEELELEKKLKENFIKDFNLQDLNDEEKIFFINAAFYAIKSTDIFKYIGRGDQVAAHNTSIANIQNFHILKALKENNEKLDTLIELLSKDKV